MLAAIAQGPDFMLILGCTGAAELYVAGTWILGITLIFEAWFIPAPF
jgi:hypothetical protein